MLQRAKNLGRTQTREDRFSDLVWEDRCKDLAVLGTFTQFDALGRWQLRSLPRERNENAPHRRKPCSGLFKIQVLRANQQVGRVVACVLILFFCDARLVFSTDGLRALVKRLRLPLMTNPPNFIHLPCVSVHSRGWWCKWLHKVAWEQVSAHRLRVV